MSQLIKSLTISDDSGNTRLGRASSSGGTFFFPSGKEGLIAVKIASNNSLMEVGRFGSTSALFPTANLDPTGKTVNFVSAQNCNGYIVCDETNRGDSYVLSRSSDGDKENILFENKIIFPRGEEASARERVDDTSFLVSISNEKKVIFYFNDKLKTFLDYNDPGNYQFKGYIQVVNHAQESLTSYDDMNKSNGEERNVSEATLFINSKTNDVTSPFFNYFPSNLSQSSFFFNGISPRDFLYFVEGEKIFFCFSLSLDRGGSVFSNFENDLFIGTFDSFSQQFNLKKINLGDATTRNIKKANSIFKKNSFVYLCINDGKLMIFDAAQFGVSNYLIQEFKPSPLTEEFVLDICETYKGLTAIVNSLGSTIVRVFGQNNDGTLHKISDEIIPMKIMKKMYYDSSSETIMMNSEKEIYAYINKSIEIPTTGPGIREWVDRYPYDRTGWYTCYIHRRPNWVSGNFGYVRSRGDGETEFSISGLFSPVAADPYVAPEDVDVTPGIHPKYSSSSFKLFFEKLLRGKRGILRGMDLREDGSDIYIGSGSMFIVDQIHISEAEFGPVNMPLPAIENSFIYYDPGTENFYFVQSGNESGLCVVLRYNNGKWMNTPKLLLNRKITTPKPGKVFLTTDWEVHLK